MTTITASTVTSTAPCSIGKSRFSTDSRLSRPSPGSAKIDSTTTVLLTSRETVSAATVTTGMRAGRIACLATTRASARPLARAVFT